MNFDKNTIAKLQKMTDEELTFVIREIASEAGIDSAALSIGKGDLAKIRTVLSLASEDDIARMLGQLGGGKNGRRS